MSEFNWRAVIEQIKNGESVDEVITNRALVALAERTDWLKSRIEQLDTTSGKLTLSSAEIDSTVSGGDWVYYDPVDDIYKQALAGLEWDTTLQTYLPTKSSMAVGIVVDKISPTNAVILIVGEGVNLSTEPDIASVQDLMQNGETFTPGRCFLSNTTPGKMTRFPAGAPLIPLGIFDTESSTIRPDVRDAFDSHYHRRFELFARPAGSLGSLGTGLLPIADGAGGAGEVAIPSHYYTVADDSSRIGLAHRRNTTKVPDSGQRRVDIAKGAAGKLVITVHKDVDPLDPEAVDPDAVSKTIDHPSYGDEIAIDWPEDGVETDLIIAFIRADVLDATRHDNGLTADLDGGLPATETDGVWKLNLPTDYKGWTNANPFLDEVPVDARLRYLSEGHYDLFESFPPIPVEGAILYKNGAVAVEGADYRFSYFDLFWLDNTFTDSAADKDVLPFYLYDYSAGDIGEVDFQLTFVQNPIGPTETVVKSFKSVSDLLEITQLGGEQKASTGALQIALKLALAIKDAKPIAAETVLAQIDEESRFILGTSVAELVAGSNTKLVKLESDGSENEAGPFVGKVRVEAVLPTLQGETTGIALFNAKESEKNGVVYTEFLPPAEAKTAVAARIKVPNIEINPGLHARLRLYALFLGEAAPGGASQAVLKVDYRIAKAGTNINTGLASALRTEAWSVPIPGGYTPFEILANELPVYGPSGSETFEKEPASSVYNLYADNLIQPNDIISVKVERVANTVPFQVGDAGSLSANAIGPDDYSGNIGLVGLRWTIDLT